MAQAATTDTQKQRARVDNLRACPRGGELPDADEVVGDRVAGRLLTARRTHATRTSAASRANERRGMT